MKYIDLHPLAAHRSLIKMALSIRSDGKTTELKTLALETHDDDADGRAAVFCRRWRDSEFTQPFFDTYMANIVRAHPEKVAGREWEIRGSRKKGFSLWITDAADERAEGDMRKCVEFIPLTLAARMKSNVDITTHRNIFIDEYIPLDGRYTKDEAKNIIELHETVDRDTETSFVMIAGNRITRFNPIFDFFNVTSWKWGYNSYQSGELEVYMHRDRENVSAKKASRLGRLLDGTAMEDYNAGEFLENDEMRLVSPRYGRTTILYIAHGGALYAISPVRDCICAHVVPQDARNAYPAPCVTLSADGAQNAVCVRAEAAKDILKMLQFYKYQNKFRLSRWCSKCPI